MISCIVAEDDQNIADVFCELLSLINMDVIATCKNGKEAVESYKKYRPDVVFMDLEMPEYDGIYGIKKIRKMDPDSKIIVVTGDLKADVSYLLESLKITALVYKPFDVNILKKVIVEEIMHT